MKAKRRYDLDWLRVGVFALLIFLVGACASAAFLSIGLTSAYDEKEAQFDRHASEMTTKILDAWSDYELFGLWVHETCRRRATVNTTLNICSRQDFHELYEYINSVGRRLRWYSCLIRSESLLP